MKMVKKLLLLSCIAGLMSGCGQIDGLAQSPFGSDSFSEIDGVFGILSDEEAAELANASEEDRTAFFAERLAALKEKHPELAEKIAAFQALTPEERQAQMQDMKGRFGMKRPGGFGNGLGHRSMGKPFHKPMGMAHGFHAPDADRMAAFQEHHPELAEQLEVLKDLAPEERQAKLAELREANPEWAPRFKPGQRPGFPGMKRGHQMHAPMLAAREDRLAALNEKNPELAEALEGLKDLSPEERKAKLAELREAHPEWAAKPARPQWPGMKRRFQEESAE